MRTSVESLEQIAVEHGRSGVGVIVIHDEQLVHYGWRLLLARQKWVSRCLAARDQVEALDLLARYSPNVAVLDLDIGHERVMDIVASLRSVSPDIAVLLLSGTTAISAKAANYIGATGVVKKTLSANDLANAVHAVSSGKRLFAISPPPGANRLSNREKEVLSLMSAGATNREIAVSLQVSAETVKRHAGKIFRKLNVRNRTEAAHRGRELGLSLPRQGASC
ncbi:MAG: response regulator transcription factor [Actinobacteria bacterium]|nr:response regulator transcription factor [Actinomycetota bacterium]OJU80829.1 MAG: hypothetical protein BGO11_19735 [Solirubrobacterales bacterium 70-9]